jgi:hypothetical protein
VYVEVITLSEKTEARGLSLQIIAPESISGEL